MYKVVKYNPEIHHRRSLRLKGYDYSRPGRYFVTICCQDHEHRFGYIENQIMVLNQYGIIAQNEWFKLPDRFQNLQLGTFQVMPNHIHAIIIINEPNAGATLAVAPDAVAPDGIGHAVAADGIGHAVAPDGIGHAVVPDGIGHAVAPDGIYHAVVPIHDEQTDSPDDNLGAGASPAPAVSSSNPTVGNIIGAYKSLVANECLKIFISNNEKMGKLWQRNYYERIIRNNQSYHAISRYIMNNPVKWTTKTPHSPVPRQNLPDHLNFCSICNIHHTFTFEA